MGQNNMVPYESIDPAGAAALRPGVSFLVSQNTIVEVLAQKRQPPSCTPTADASDFSGVAEMNMSPRTDDDNVPASDIEYAFVALKMKDTRQASEAYRRMGELLKASGSQSRGTNGPETKKAAERISALSDGALSREDIEVAFASLHTWDGRRAWDVYHRIGDVLREQVLPSLSPGFAEPLATRLAQEPMPIRRARVTDEIKADVTLPSPSAPGERR